MRRLALLCAALALPAGACELPGGESRALDRRGSVALAFVAGEPRLGEYFALQLLLCRDGRPWSPDRVDVDAVMPAHNHGMNYRAAIERLGEGRYRADGLLLHMPGMWRIVVTVDDGERGREAAFELRR